MNAVILGAVSVLCCGQLIAEDMEAPPVEIVVKGDLRDAQEIYRVTRDLQPPPKIIVEVQPPKHRNVQLVKIFTEKLLRDLHPKEDPYPKLIKDYVIYSELVIGIWDILQAKPELKDEVLAEANSNLDTLTRRIATFYGIPEDIPLDDGIMMQIEWKQLEHRGVKVIHPPKE